MLTLPTDTFGTAEVAGRAGVHRDTLLRWLREGKIPEPSRDRNGWRFFTQGEAQAVVQFARQGAPVSDPAPDSSRPTRLPGLDRLEELDWDFLNAKTSYLTHGLHPYPAKFIPQIPNALIQELSSVGDTVADPFCGSGTTLVEALTLKRNAVGVDANPLAVLISRAKTTLLSDPDVEFLTATVSRARSLEEALDSKGGTLFPRGLFTSTSWRPSHDAISFWFEPYVVEELAEVLGWCKMAPTEEARAIALTAFSSVVVTVSKQDSDTRYARRSKGTAPGDVFKRFARALADAIRAAVEFTEIVEPRFSCNVLHADILSAPKVGGVDLVVCSPPYPNAYSYHLYHMTRMIWLGMDQPTFKRLEIGSHRKYSNKGIGRATIDTFRSEMTNILSWLGTFLRRDGHACFVLGDSIINGQKFSNADLVSSVAGHCGFREVSRIDRNMQVTKKAFNPAYGNIKREQIVILCNSGERA
jgi:hypothetical protein